MARKMPAPDKMEIDLIPLTDIVFQLLVFLIVVSDMSRSATAVKMTLPRASEATKDADVKTEGRIVVQMQFTDGRYWAVVEKKRYELIHDGQNQSLLKYLDELIARRMQVDGLKLDEQGGVPFPVKLRVPEDAPMREVERVVMTLARAKLVNIQYAVQNNPKG